MMRGVYVMVEENPNCPPDERMLRDNGKKRVVEQLNLDIPQGGAAWCDVAGVAEGGAFGPAYATQVEDSSAGTAWLIFGGGWGLRFRPSELKEEWSLSSKNQWGEAFKVFDISGTDIRFKEGSETSLLP